ALPGDTSLTLRVTATDRAGLSTTELTDIGVSAPRVAVAGLSTSPSPAHARHEVDLSFTVCGFPADLASVTSVRATALGRRLALVHDPLATPSASCAAGEQAKVYTSKMVAPPLEAPSSTRVVPVVASLELGPTLTKTVDLSYTVEEDASGPDIAILSPVEGVQLEAGRPIDWLLDVEDAAGVASVAYTTSWDSSPVSVPGRERFSLTIPTAQANTQGASVTVTATDTLGNTASLTRTFGILDVTEGVPTLAIVSPALDDTEMRERQSLSVRVEVDGAANAELYLEVYGATETSTQIAAAPEGISSHTVTLPAVDQDAVVALRLEAAGATETYKARRWITVLNDDSVGAPHELSLVPGSRILAGTELYVMAEAPQDMTDRAPQSSVAVVDGAVRTELADDGQWSGVEVGFAGAEVRVDTELHDLSGNPPALGSQTLRKDLYFTDSGVESFLDMRGGTLAAAHPVVTGSGAQLIFTSNDPVSGWELRSTSAAQPITTYATGHALAVADSGTHAFVQHRADDDLRVSAWPRDGSAWGVERSAVVRGDLVGAIGEVAVVSYGETIGGIYLGAGGSLELLGHRIPGARDVVIHQDLVLVLDDQDTLHALSVSLDPAPALVVAWSGSLSALPEGYVGVRPTSDGVVAWSADQLDTFALSVSGASMTALATSSIPIGAAPSAVAVDEVSDAAAADAAPIIWARIEDPLGPTQGLPTWFAFSAKDEAVVGVALDDVDHMAFTPGTAWRVRTEGAPSVLEVGLLVPAAPALDESITITHDVTELEVELSAAWPTCSLSWSVETGAGDVVPA
ncbi:MAG: hypothetical protein AAGI01_14665, partial [Myxococcota bacterium]